MRHAVAAMLVVNDEIFVVKRQSYLSAFPGYYAFPGGKIDQEDEQSGANLATELDPVHVNALCRELLEELSFDINEANKLNVLQGFVHFGTATTPVTEVVRYAVHHYKILLKAKPVFTLDCNELESGEWVKFADFYQRYLCGEVLLVTPMLRSIIALAQNPSTPHLSDFSDDPDSRALDFYPFLHDIYYAAIPSNTLPPAYATNALLMGDKDNRKVLVDPSPKSVAVLTELNEVLNSHHIDAILLSHHHGDHHQFSMDIARGQDIPILCTELTVQHLHQTLGAAYTEGVAIELINEGTVITRWKGNAIRVYALPGHDEGMVGLAPDNMAWFFVADLAQSYGSIFIPEDEGNLSHYMQSLQRVIDLNPAVVLPSHGIAEGGVHMLQRTLDHRMDRENQIRALLKDGVREEQLYNWIYPALAPKLKPLAMQSLKQHLTKLAAEEGEY